MTKHTTKPGTFQYEEFIPRAFTRDRRPRIQWDYRARNGQLYSGIAKSLEDAKRVAEYVSGEAIR